MNKPTIMPTGDILGRELMKLEQIELLIPLYGGDYAIYGLPVERIKEVFPEFDWKRKIIVLDEGEAWELYQALHKQFG